LIGLGLNLLFVGAQLAGMVIGQQAGLSLGRAYNPLVNESNTILGQVYFTVMFLVFIVAGGHRAAVRALLDSFDSVPLLSFTTGPVHATLIADLLHSTYVMGLKLAGPCLIAMFMATITMGFLSKTMPQLNILSVGFVVRVLVVLGVAGLSIAVSDGVFDQACYDTIMDLRNVLGLV
jgi:flagellar biosynthetic protein FliR